MTHSLRPPDQLLPVFWDTGTQVHFIPGRDRRGHFVPERYIEEPCPHSCCRHRKTADRPRVVRRRVDKWGTPVNWSLREKLHGDHRPANHAKTRARIVREDYGSYLHAHYLAAENATNGFMVNKAGRARGIDPADFFRPGRRPSVEKWGSDELRAWFGSGHVAAGGRGHQILSLTEFERQQRGARR